MPEPNQKDAPIFRCLTTGSGLNRARKTLKVTFPKKKQEAVTVLRFTGTQDALQMSLPGAADSMPALVSGPFVCEIPWLSFKFIWETPRDDRELLTLRFSSGWFEVGGMRTQTPGIIVYTHSAEPGASLAAWEAELDSAGAPENAIAAPPTAALPVTAPPIDPADVPMDLPLLEAYFYLKQYGIRPLMGNQRFLKQTEQVDHLLKRAGKLLAPLGISRREIEQLIDQKFGKLDPE